MIAEHIQVGDRLLTIDGKWRKVTAITPVKHEETVYNFTVDNDHDYFVGETGFLVHNAKCKTCTPGNNGPLPPGWTPDWNQFWSPSSSKHGGGYHWFDPNGGEWHFHTPDSSHDAHWDHNPWDETACTPWSQVPLP